MDKFITVSISIKQGGDTQTVTNSVDVTPDIGQSVPKELGTSIGSCLHKLGGLSPLTLALAVSYMAELSDYVSNEKERLAFVEAAIEYSEMYY